MANKKKRFDVISPDGFSINFSGTYKSVEDAQKGFKNWKKRFELQGYYSSVRGRISLDELEQYCRIVEV